MQSRRLWFTIAHWEKVSKWIGDFREIAGQETVALSEPKGLRESKEEEAEGGGSFHKDESTEVEELIEWEIKEVVMAQLRLFEIEI
jgi:hypothetical protein